MPGGRGGRTVGAKRSLLIEILGLPLAVRVYPARPHDVTSGRELLDEHLPELPNVAAIVADPGYRRSCSLALKRGVKLDIKLHLGRWRLLSRCYEGTESSAKAWLEVAATAYLLTRLRVLPP